MIREKKRTFSPLAKETENFWPHPYTLYVYFSEHLCPTPKKTLKQLYTDMDDSVPEGANEDQICDDKKVPNQSIYLERDCHNKVQ